LPTSSIIPEGRDREVRALGRGEPLELGVRAQRVPDHGRRVGPLDAGVHPLGVLAEDHGIDGGLIVTPSHLLSHEVQRVAREGAARADADIQVEPLPHPDDRAEVGEPLVAQPRVELGRRLGLRLRCDRTEQAELVLREELDGLGGQGVALVDPEVPTDVGVDVVGVEADRFQYADCLGEYGLSDPVPWHRDDGVLGHECCSISLLDRASLTPDLSA
jgi:hypothetical protein